MTGCQSYLKQTDSEELRNVELISHVLLGKHPFGEVSAANVILSNITIFEDFFKKGNTDLDFQFNNNRI